MPRQQAIFPQVNFIGGLVTETTALNFPENACLETWNCVFEHTGRVSRRPGLDVEDNHQFLTLAQTYDETDTHSEFFWEVVGSQDSQPFLVVQRGHLLYFFKAQDSLDFSQYSYHQIIDLTDYVPAGSTADPALHRCSFAEGRGHLLVTNPACDPLYIVYREDSGTLDPKITTIRYRDFKGLDDGLTLTQRVTASVSGLKTSNPSHYYNLLNQGWHIGDALSQWDTARSDMPSNADFPSYYRASETDLFDDSRVNTAFSGVANTPAPRGHFILDAGSPSRNAAMTAEGFTGATVNEIGYSNVALTGLTTVSGGTITRPTNMYDNSTNQNQSNSTVLANGAYSGKTFASGTNIRTIILYGANGGSVGATSTPGSSGPGSTTNGGFGATGNIQVYVKTGSAPTTSTDGTLLTTFTISSASTSGRILTFNTNDTTDYDHIWIRNTTGNSVYVAELQVYTGDSEYNRPALVSFYAGRACYAGLINEGGMNSIYFSQIVERDEQYGSCFQKNDPTDENFFDLLPDDGGVITIPEVGNILAMVPYQNSLLVIASNGVWSISGSGRGPFKADDYEIRKLSDISTPSSFSVLTRRGIPIWWAEDGIYTVQYDANYDSFTVMSLTERSISSFIQDIPLENRKYVKGAYDYNDDKLYWLYREDPLVTPADRHNYNRALVMNGVSGAFYPWSFSEDGVIRIKGFVYTRLYDSLDTPRIKYIVEDPINNVLSFAEISDTTNWIDWSIQGDNLDYLSYIITGYKIRGEGLKDGSITYFMPFLEEQEGTSLFAQSIFGYTTSPNTGRWSTKQQCYYEGPFQQAIRYRRLKIRGHGTAMQIRFESETGKPFSLIGWTALESVASEV